METKTKWKAGHSREFVELEPAASWTEIGAACGVSRQRAQAIYKTALAKLLRGLNRHDINAETLAELLAKEPEVTKEPDATSTRVNWVR